MNSNLDYFVLFGVPRSFSQEAAYLKTRLYQLQRTVHPDNFANALPHEKQAAGQMAAMVNTAYQTLIDPLKRAIYLLKCHGIDIQDETNTQMPSDFLMEQIELREQLAEIANHQNKEKLRNVQSIVAKAIANNEHYLSLIVDHHVDKLTEARMVVRKMLFFNRLADEISQLQQMLV